MPALRLYLAVPLLRHVGGISGDFGLLVVEVDDEVGGLHVPPVELVELHLVLAEPVQLCMRGDCPSTQQGERQRDAGNL